MTIFTHTDKQFKRPKFTEGFSDLTQSVETKKALMVSGGDGYIDFRLGLFYTFEKKLFKGGGGKRSLVFKNVTIGDEDVIPHDKKESNERSAMTEQIRARDLAHLLIWETECPVKELTGLSRDEEGQ